jgi:hypothetical protein
MTNSEFRQWITGYFTLADESFLDKNQIKVIQNHAALVATVEPLDTDISTFLNFLALNIDQYDQVCCEKAKPMILRAQ